MGADGHPLLAALDARALPEALRGADAHVSFAVFEHIPPAVLHGIVAESARTLAPGGHAAHIIDLSDHFAHADPSITRVHFLRFGARAWALLAGNRHAYHNRLRADDLRALFDAAGMERVHEVEHVDARSLDALRRGLPLAPAYRGLPPERLAVTGYDVVARPRPAEARRP